MKTSLTLSAVLFALTLTPAAFANGAQEQTQERATADTAATRHAITVVTPAPATPSLTRSVLQRLDVDVRQELIGSLRESAMQVLQLAAPVLVEATGASTGKLELTSR